MSLYRRLLILLAVVGYCGHSIGQGIVWQDATPICDPNSATTFFSLPDISEYDQPEYPSSIEPCNSYFSFNLNNPAWYRFQATSTTISMDISIRNCVGTGHGVGVQYALVQVIDGVPVPVNCNSDANVGSGNTFTTSDLTVGNTYFLVLDGFAESTCEYSISNAVGFDDPEITERVTQLIVNDQPNINSGCRRNGAVKVSAVDASNNAIANANSYNWEITSLDGNGFSAIVQRNRNSLNVENIPPGNYQVVLQVGNACDAGIEYTLDFTVEPNNFSFLTPETVCLEQFSDEYIPTNPAYRGPPLTGLPTNLPTRDTFFVEIDNGLCPEIQVLPINFVDGINTTSRTVDTTTCNPDGVFINGDQYRPRAAGSLPYYVPLDGECGGFIELTVTWFVIGGDIGFDECDTKGATLKYLPGFNAFEDFRSFATYEWKDADGIVVSNDEVYQVATSGEYSLTLTIQQGNNPPCSFDIPPLSVSVNNLNDLDIECTNEAIGSVGVQWNGITGVDSYAVGANGRIIEDDITDLNFTLDNLNLGDEVNFFIFANSTDPNCQPLRDSISCQALDCPLVELEIIEVGPGTVPDSLSYCVDAGGSNTTEFEVRIISGASPAGVGRWIIRGGGTLEGDRNSDRIIFNPNDNDAGEYLLGYQYVDGNCETFLDRDSEVYIEVVIPPIRTDLDRIGRLEFEDGICVGEELEFRYNGNAGRTAIPIFSGDVNDGNLTGSLDGRFSVTFNTPGTKNFDFMITDDNGCDSGIEPYSIEVGEPLIPQAILCDSPPEGMRFDWPDQPCVEEYRIFINGSRQSPDITVSEYIYTRAVEGRMYEIEVVAVSDCGCGTTSFNIISCPYAPDQVCSDVTVELNLVAGDTLICVGGGVATIGELEAILTGEDPAGVGMWEVNTGNAAISPDGDFDPNVAGVGQHQVKYIWTEGDCVYQDSINFVISDASTVNFQMEVLDPVCFGENTGTLNVNVSGVDPDFGVYIDEDAIGSKDTSFILESGMHFVSVIDSLTGCDTLAEINIAQGPDSLFLFPADEYFSRGEDNLTITLDSTFATTIDSLDWVFNGEPICEDLVCGENFVFEPQESGLLCFEGYYSGMCFYRECAEVTYFPEFMAYIPNVISLSSNELDDNKTFQVYTNDPLAVVNKMNIFDRWGNAVYQNSTEGTTMSWDPRSKNCLPGVYAYFIEITQADGKVSSFPGTITVVE